MSQRKKRMSNEYIGIEYSPESKLCVHFVEGDCLISWDKNINDFHSCNQNAVWCHKCIANFIKEKE